MRYIYISDDKSVLAILEDDVVQILQQVHQDDAPTEENDDPTLHRQTRKARKTRVCRTCGKEGGHGRAPCPQKGLNPRTRTGRPRKDEYSDEHEIQPVTLSDEELAAEVKRLREEGADSLRIAATLKIPLKKVNQFWTYSEPEELPPDAADTSPDQ